jgi:hypothetical protein
MIIFLNDDRAYLAWVTHHRRGFVLDGKRKPKVSHLTLHRATCAEVKSAASRHVHWTTATKLKACSLSRAELEQWALEETAAGPAYCTGCCPESEATAEQAVHLSKLASEILEYILEAALIHFEVEQPPYRLTIGDIAACFAKTPGQIGPAVRQLVDDGLIVVEGAAASTANLRPNRVVLPTARALRTLEAFREASDGELDVELAKLAHV